MLAIRDLGRRSARVARRPEHLSVLTSGTDLDNEMRCAAAVRAALGDAYGTPAQAALRFALNNRDLATRVIGIGELGIPRRGARRRREGPLPSAAIAKLNTLWATDFH